jgi:ferric-dicitrate binding protein FerR (iron transport regulator)
VWKAKKEEQSAAEAKAQAQAKALEEERKRQERQEKIRSAAAVLMEAVLWLLVWCRHRSKTCLAHNQTVLRVCVLDR